MILFTYDTPRPRPGTFPNAPDSVDDIPELPLPLPEEEPGEWGDPITVEVDDPEKLPDNDNPPGTLDEEAPADPKDPLPGDKLVEPGIPAKDPSPDTTDAPD